MKKRIKFNYIYIGNKKPIPVIVVTNSNAINTFSINDIPNNSFGNLSTRLHIDFSICFTYKQQQWLLSVISITCIQIMNAARRHALYKFYTTL